MTTPYNYERFDVYVESGADAQGFGAFPGMLHAGERAPGGELPLLDGGERVRLSELWRQGGVVLEFGSFMTVLRGRASSARSARPAAPRARLVLRLDA